MADINGLPPDLQVQQAALDRKRQLAQMLLQQGMQQPQGQMVSGHFVAPNPLQYIAGLVQRYKGQQQLADLDTAQQGISTQYNEGLKAGIEKYLTTRDGKPGQTMTDGQAADLLQNDNAPELAEPVKADPRRAMLEALTSGYGPLQQLGQADIAAQQKQVISPLDYLKLEGFDPTSRQAAAAGGGVAALKEALKPLVVDKQVLVGTPTGGYKTTNDLRPSFGPVGQVGAGANGEPIIGQREAWTGEVKFAPVGTRVSVDNGTKAGNAFATKLAEKRADRIEKSFDTAQSAAKAIDALEHAEADVGAGIKSGLTGQVALGMAKFAKSLGMEADPQIVNTESFRANMARETLNLVKGLGAGTGISNADREFAEKASGGSILLDDQSILRLMNIAKAAAANVLLSHQQLLEAQQGATGTLSQDLESFRVPLVMQASDQLIYDPDKKRFSVKAPAMPSKAIAVPRTAPAAKQPTTPPGVTPFLDWLYQ